MKITDIRGAAEIAHGHGACLVADNTFASPYLQRPLEHGADVVVHSLTKLINGHSDVVGGMIVTKTEVLFKRLRRTLSLFGGTMDPHQAWLILRGIRTLPLRVEKSQENAMRLAEFLKVHPRVLWVRYPGLPDHPQYETAKRQMDGFGAMICFGVKGGLEAGKKFIESVTLLSHLANIGDAKSLVIHPASTTHQQLTKDEQEQTGVTADFIRLSIGLEDVEDIKEDIDQALKKSAG